MPQVAQLGQAKFVGELHIGLVRSSPTNVDWPDSVGLKA